MISTTLAGRSALAARSAPSATTRRAASAILTFARLCFRGSPAPRIDDHLLQDIGLTRADYEALRG